MSRKRCTGRQFPGAEQGDRVGGGGLARKQLLQARAQEDLDQVILGFYVRDRLGQNLFGDNTYLSAPDRPRNARAGDLIEARFRFRMPYLPVGDYSIAAAIANGTHDDHVQHHWYDDALFFRVHSSHLGTVLMGIPILAIDLDIRTPTADAPEDVRRADA